MDGRTSGILSVRYSGVYVIENIATNRLYVGLKLKSGNSTPGVLRKLSVNALQSGLYEDSNETLFSASSLIIYMNLK
jgi:hypothetical protein